MDSNIYNAESALNRLTQMNRRNHDTIFAQEEEGKEAVIEEEKTEDAAEEVEEAKEETQEEIADATKEVEEAATELADAETEEEKKAA